MQLAHSISGPPLNGPGHHFGDFAIGTIGGLTSEALTAIANRMETFDHVLATLTHIAGLGCAGITLLLLMWRWKHRRQLLEHEVCKPRREEPEEPDDIPM